MFVPSRCIFTFRDGARWWRAPESRCKITHFPDISQIFDNFAAGSAPAPPTHLKLSTAKTNNTSTRSQDADHDHHPESHAHHQPDSRHTPEAGRGPARGHPARRGRLHGRHPRDAGARRRPALRGAGCGRRLRHGDSRGRRRHGQPGGLGALRHADPPGHRAPRLRQRPRALLGHPLRHPVCHRHPAPGQRDDLRPRQGERPRLLLHVRRGLRRRRERALRTGATPRAHHLRQERDPRVP